MNYFNDLPVLVDAIVNPNGSVKKFANARPASNRRTNMRERGQKIDVIEKSNPESLSRRTAIFADELQSFV